MKKSDVYRILNRLYHYSRTHNICNNGNVVKMSDYVVSAYISFRYINITIYQFSNEKVYEKYNSYYCYKNHYTRKLVTVSINYKSDDIHGCINFRHIFELLVKNRNSLILTING